MFCYMFNFNKKWDVLDGMRLFEIVALFFTLTCLQREIERPKGRRMYDSQNGREYHA